MVLSIDRSHLEHDDVGDTKQSFGSVLSFLKNLEIRFFGLAGQYNHSLFATAKNVLKKKKKKNT